MVVDEARCGGEDNGVKRGRGRGSGVLLGPSCCPRTASVRLGALRSGDDGGAWYAFERG